MLKQNFQKGSVFVLSLIFSSIVSMVLASVIAMQSHYHKINSQSLNRTKAINTANSGAELVIHELKKDPDARFGTGWSISGNTYQFIDSDGNIYSINISGLI